MNRLIRLALLSAICISGLLQAASASASGTGPVVVNTTSTHGSAANSVVTFNTAGGARTLTCGSMTLDLTVTSLSGSVSSTFPPTFAFCRFGAIGATVSTATWTGAIRHLDSPGGTFVVPTLDLTVPALGMTVGAPGCSFTLSGTLLGDAQNMLVTHFTLFNVGGMRFPASLVTNSLTLRVSNVSGIGCGALGVANGNLASFAANISWNPQINMAGI